MITVEEYATKVETFISLWREGIITAKELKENIEALGGEVSLTTEGVFVSSKPKSLS